MPSVTYTSPNIQVEGPILEVHFSISSELEKKYINEGKSIPVPIVVKSLIDTGASSCTINGNIPKKLGLEPVGKIKINTPSSKDHECFQYVMRMFIPAQGLTYEGVFTAVSLDGQIIEALIGRDLLQQSIFIYIGYMNQFTFSLL